jgi:putative oxidoreductase
MLAGYKTRLVALGLAIYVLAAGLIAHTHFVDGNQLSHFMKNMAIVGGSLAFVAFGGGAYSLDGRKS